MNPAQSETTQVTVVKDFQNRQETHNSACVPFRFICFQRYGPGGAARAREAVTNELIEQGRRFQMEWLIEQGNGSLVRVTGRDHNWSNDWALPFDGANSWGEMSRARHLK
jgi:hypothetical protein